MRPSIAGTKVAFDGLIRLVRTDLLRLFWRRDFKCPVSTLTSAPAGDPHVFPHCAAPARAVSQVRWLLFSNNCWPPGIERCSVRLSLELCLCAACIALNTELPLSLF